MKACNGSKCVTWDPRGRSLAGIAGSNPTGAMDVCCEFCALSCRGLCDVPIPRPEESNRLYVSPNVIICKYNFLRLQ